MKRLYAAVCAWIEADARARGRVQIGTHSMWLDNTPIPTGTLTARQIDETEDD